MLVEYIHISGTAVCRQTCPSTQHIIIILAQPAFAVTHQWNTSLNWFDMREDWASSFEFEAHRYVPLVLNTFRSFPHSWLITRFVTRVTWRVSLVEQELLTLVEHLSSPPVFSEISCYSIFSFMCMLCRLLFVLLYFFSWSLCCLSFFNLQLLITPLVSSNSSYDYIGRLITMI
jgi:hypothetical protein